MPPSPEVFQLLGLGICYCNVDSRDAVETGLISPDWGPVSFRANEALPTPTNVYVLALGATDAWSRNDSEDLLNNADCPGEKRPVAIVRNFQIDPGRDELIFRPVICILGSDSHV